jgi:hypothetical protein
MPLAKHLARIICCFWLCSFWGAQAASNLLYSTGFSAAEGFDWRYELAGQNGWVKDIDSDGGNGITTNFFGSYAAYVGLFELNPKDDFINLWRPVTNSLPLSDNPVVHFSTRMAVIDSTTNRWDDFFWSVYNQAGDRLLTLDFDNYSYEINYLLEGSTNWVYTGVNFVNDTAYTLRIRMDLAANKWSASLDSSILATNLPITTTGVARNLGDVDAVWAIYERDWPGDNFMIFDNYTITEETTSTSAPVPATLKSLGRTSNGLFLLRVYGLSGARYAVEASSNLGQWTSLRTNLVTDGYFDFIDANSPPARRFYRARFVP